MPYVYAFEYIAACSANISNEKGTHCCQSSDDRNIFAVLKIWMFTIVRLENAKGKWKTCLVCQ
jgi:hypothetical protein